MIHEDKELGTRFQLLAGDCLDVMKTLADNSVDSVVTDPPAGISFMGKSWDDDKGGRKQWTAWLESVMRECLRVMKPGAHGFVWAIPRTSHWTATALEDAGFEIRDVVTHLFGSGFPKSLDVSKAIDKAAGEEREVVGESKRSQSRASSGLEHRPWMDKQVDGRFDITAPATDAAKQWSGWGTALKPASEHWILIRKPISEKNVAANVLRWGCGGLNIDGCRIETADNLNGGTYSGGTSQVPGNHIGRPFVQPAGRFPANLILSCSPNCTEDAHDMFDCPMEIMDAQAGSQVSRFFYSAKASKSERNAGCEGLPSKAQGAYGEFAGDGRGRQTEHQSTSNFHPTVKPTKLMSYLIRMVTPPGGTVLDPFTGSGSTGVAALREGFKFIGIEREPEYIKIAQARIAHQEHAK